MSDIGLCCHWIEQNLHTRIYTLQTRFMQQHKLHCQIILRTITENENCLNITPLKFNVTHQIWSRQHLLGDALQSRIASMEARFPWQIDSLYVIILFIVVRSLSFFGHWSKMILDHATKFELIGSLSILIHVKLSSLIF